MKKRALLGLTAISAVGAMALGGYEYMNKEPKTVSAVEINTKSPIDLFILNERTMRQIVRNGDQSSYDVFPNTLSQINAALVTYHDKGFKTDKIHMLIEQYEKDTNLMLRKITPYMSELSKESHYEKINESKFMEKLDQIGLYELKEQYKRIEKERIDYIKKPSMELKETYLNDVNKLKEIISELYLDSSIENVLFGYVNNHKLYFQTIDSVYTHVGFETIERMRDNGYAIKTELEFLPRV